MKTTKIASLATLALLSACAASPYKIAPAQVSDAEYRTMDCGHLAAELENVETALDMLGVHQSKAARSDAIAVGVGAAVFWPAALIPLLNNGANRDGIARLKGERVAILEVQKEQCGATATPSLPDPK